MNEEERRELTRLRSEVSGLRMFHKWATAELADQARTILRETSRKRIGYSKGSARRLAEGGKMSWLVLPVALILFGGLAWIRSGHGGGVGRHIRRSDWLAWRDAVDRTERKISELRKAEPKQ
jgi:hypothetical protein